MSPADAPTPIQVCLDRLAAGDACQDFLGDGGAHGVSLSCGRRHHYFTNVGPSQALPQSVAVSLSKTAHAFVAYFSAWDLDNDLETEL